MYYILNNNKRPYSMGVSYKPWNTLTSLISYNSEGDSCSLNFVLCMIKYKIKHKIVNCDKIESATSHDLYPPCHKLSHFLRSPPPFGAWHTLWTALKEEGAWIDVGEDRDAKMVKWMCGT